MVQLFSSSDRGSEKRIGEGWKQRKKRREGAAAQDEGEGVVGARVPGVRGWLCTRGKVGWVRCDVGHERAHAPLVPAPVRTEEEEARWAGVVGGLAGWAVGLASSAASPTIFSFLFFFVEKKRKEIEGKFLGI